VFPMLLLLLIAGPYMTEQLRATLAPVAALKRQTTLNVAADGRKPASCVTAGKACRQPPACVTASAKAGFTAPPGSV
jgi:hypothetical protein